MTWYYLAAFLFVVMIAMLIYSFVRDRKYMRKKTRDAISEDLWEEIQVEREENSLRRERFTKALKDAENKE